MLDSNGNVRFMSHVGAGSSEQCLVGALTTSLLISSAVMSSKADNLSQGRSTIVGDGAFAVSTRILSSYLLRELITVQPSRSNLLQQSISSLQLVSRSQAAPSGMPHLTCGTSFLLLFVFLISLILHHHPALLRYHALILDHLLTFLTAFSILVLKLSFPQSLSIHSRLSFPQADLLESGL